MKFFFKRAFDLVAAGFGLVFLGPLLVVVGLLVWINLGWPVLYRQKRPGLKGQIFTIYKVRSMRNALDRNGKELSDEERLTRFGSLLRKASLDELPELYNVVRGEMSLVGPRPLLTEYLERYTPEQAQRHDVRPGITGWAQINGRNAISFEEKFKYDVWYVDHWTFWLDIKIIFLTFWKVLQRQDISAPGHVTTYKFGENPPGADSAAPVPPKNAVEKPPLGV